LASILLEGDIALILICPNTEAMTA
jgi:hypothetical protein